ncbi:DID domain-containing protein [Cryptosporidium ubiquitum]|uniref:DID domain-containing protein n=1 Tax=Cryptosporidium ubiquitum TaxID=857276 RepID=A0A1J4ML83_9CRYT|nr:DID domain-containing protein [Cryptosporidium ubiquitum]OII75018.1 DID domain-containing protein [Cryptosporidium ubiquitum]
MDDFRFNSALMKLKHLRLHFLNEDKEEVDHCIKTNRNDNFNSSGRANCVWKFVWLGKIAIRSKKNMGIWWGKVDIRDELNKNKRAVSKAIREVDREIQKLEQEEAKLMREIRVAVEKGYTESAKIFSRDILKVRRQMEKLNLARSQLMGAELRLTSVKSQLQVNSAISDLNSIMGKVNESTEISRIQGILRNFARESDKLDVKGDIINDSIDEALGSECQPEEEEALVNKIYMEVCESVKQGKEKESVRGKGPDIGKLLSSNTSSKNNIEDGDSGISIEERIRKLGENR